MKYKQAENRSIYMENSIRYTSEHPTDFNGLLSLYESLGWNSLKLTVNELERMCKQSWYAIYVLMIRG